MQISCAVISNSLMEYISSNFPAIFHSVYKTKEVRSTFLVAEMLDSRFPPKSHRKHTTKTFDKMPRNVECIQEDMAAV